MQYAAAYVTAPGVAGILRRELCADAGRVTPALPAASVAAHRGALGFDARFKRMGEYYLSYCEAGFWSAQSTSA
jgi:hypothetical protein